ncbi:MAG TPA: OmpH family outer membrane protein [Alkalispirochaeta sp.]|nr:OmpH family outer membrane protein [Alkalispirochaeta sp.]
MHIQPTARRVSILLIIAALILPAAVSAEQLTTVAVVDIDEVYNSFYRDSQGVRELERLRQEYQEEIDREVDQLEELEERRAQAQDRGTQRRIDQLTQEIEELERYLQELTRRRRQQLEERQESLLSDDFFRQMQEAIQFVAESEGYTVILRSDSDGLQWWSVEVDISDLVVNRLIQVADR